MVRGSMALLVAVAALTIAACNKQEENDQNIIVDNGVMSNAEIEALPPDESSSTPSDQLANGDDNADVSDLNAASNAD